MSYAVNFHPQCVEAAQSGQLITICPECYVMAFSPVTAEYDPIRAYDEAIDAISNDWLHKPYDVTKSSIWDRPGLRGFK